jgi:hypothetical protein
VRREKGRERGEREEGRGGGEMEQRGRGRRERRRDGTVAVAGGFVIMVGFMF